MFAIRRDQLLPLLLAGTILAVAGWAYYPTVAGLVRTWDTDPNYSHGFIVPLLAAYILWHQTRAHPRPAIRPDVWGGPGLLAVATGLRAAAGYLYMNALDHLSMMVAVGGLTLLLAGRGWLRRAWPAWAVLVFIVPIPPSVGGSNLIDGLQGVATRASTAVLQTLGLVAFREGNTILLPTVELGVEEACSGLKMLMVFCALTVTTAVLLPVGPVRKVLLVLSAVPLALACNVIRITAAGLAGEQLGSKTGHFVFHDLAGWLMVPLAFALLTAEVLLLGRLVRAEHPARL